MDLPALSIDRRRGNRARMHVQTNTRTLSHHWGPHICGSTGQDHPVGNPRSHVAGPSHDPHTV